MTTEAKQDCVIAATLLCRILSTMLVDAVQIRDTAFPIRYRFDGTLFNQRKFITKSKVHIVVLDEILYADGVDKMNG